MPIDRDDTLKRAEKLLRQGRLDAAIAEYSRVVAEFPRDWNTANLLGDLFVRAGNVASASQQYTRVAEHLAADGFVAKAAALYKKILKLNPADEQALLRSAELASAQSLTADVRTFMTALFQLRLRRGDRQGAADLARVRVGFDPSDVVGHLDAARMLAEAGEQAGAATELRVAGQALQKLGRLPEAARAFREALRFSAQDADARSGLLAVLLLQGDLDGASALAESADELAQLADAAQARGAAGLARATLGRLASLDPSRVDVRLNLARAALTAGDLGEAERWAGVEAAAEHPDLAVLLGEVYLRQGRVEEGRTLLSEAVSREAASLSRVAALAESLAKEYPDAAVAALAVVVDDAVERGELDAARRRLLPFVEASPDAVGALRLLIDVCVDGGFEPDLRLAQLRLADALLRREAWQDARVVAEDLVASAPDREEYRDRLRQALDALGLSGSDELDLGGLAGTDDDLGPLLPPDLVEMGPPGAGVLSDDFSDLVDVLSKEAGQEPDLDPAGLEVPPSLAAPPVPPDDPADLAVAPLPEAHDEPADFAFAWPRRGPSGGTRQPDLAIVDDDLRRLFEDHGPAAPAAPTEGAFEIDLSDALDGILSQAPAAAEPPDADGLKLPPRQTDEAGGDAGDLDRFFQGLRDEAVVDRRGSEADAQVAEAESCLAAGDETRARTLLRQAARDVKVRFKASRLLAGLARQRGDLAEAIEWLERASEVPAPTLDDWRVLLYDLAAMLEESGEQARALAVLLELRAATPGYRDVDQRIEGLAGRQRGWGTPGTERGR